MTLLTMGLLRFENPPVWLGTAMHGRNFFDSDCNFPQVFSAVSQQTFISMHDFYMANKKCYFIL